MTDLTETLDLASGRLTASVALLGAELQTLADAGGRALLWHGDAAWWTGRAPLLFPIVGALANDRHTVDGIAYTLPKHGFARRSRFVVVARTADAATLRLVDDATTRAAYPYRFQLDVTYALDGATLSHSVTVANRDTKPIPVGFGFHPAFLWPLPGAGARAAQTLSFEADEPTPAWRIDTDGLVARQEPATRIIDRQLVLTDDLFDEDALLLLEPASRRVRFGAGDGSGTALDIRFPDMPHLGVWTKPDGAPYLCIEPWHGYASPASFTGSLMEKPGMAILAPGEVRTYAMTVTVVAPDTNGLFG